MILRPASRGRNAFTAASAACLPAQRCTTWPVERASWKCGRLPERRREALSSGFSLPLSLPGAGATFRGLACCNGLGGRTSPGATQVRTGREPAAV
jgi:hypothetical protein